MVSKLYSMLLECECRTIGGPAGSGRDCVFPFTYKNKTYDDCPRDPEDR